EDKEGVSPTEREFDEATRTHKTRLIFVTGTPSPKRHPKQQSLVRKAEDAVVRKKFNSPTELRSAVYVALVRWLEDKEFLRTGPFDASYCGGASLFFIDPERLAWFARLAA